MSFKHEQEKKKKNQVSTLEREQGKKFHLIHLIHSLFVYCLNNKKRIVV